MQSRISESDDLGRKVKTYKGVGWGFVAIGIVLTIIVMLIIAIPQGPITGGTRKGLKVICDKDYIHQTSIGAPCKYCWPQAYKIVDNECVCKATDAQGVEGVYKIGDKCIYCPSPNILRQADQICECVNGWTRATDGVSCTQGTALICGQDAYKDKDGNCVCPDGFFPDCVGNCLPQYIIMPSEKDAGNAQKLCNTTSISTCSPSINGLTGSLDECKCSQARNPVTNQCRQ